MNNVINGAKSDIIIVDEFGTFDSTYRYGYCRVCNTWKLLHTKPGDTIRFRGSCDEYVPEDNLEYLEWLNDKRTTL